MTVQTFQKLLTQRPFKPSRLVMSGGKTYEILSPATAFLTQHDLLVGVGEIENNVPAEFDICSLLHVSAIEPLPRPATSDAGPSAP